MQWTDTQVEKTIGHLLRIGVVVAAILVLTGGIWYAKDFARPIPDYHTFHSEPEAFRKLGSIFTDVWHPSGLIQLGVLALLLTPIARVAFCLLAFGIERDWVYVGFTAVVFGLLMYSLLS